MLSLLQAIWQADGTFPSGAFAFSYGVEGVVALRPELDGAALAELTATVLRQRWETCDRVALVQAFRAAGAQRLYQRDPVTRRPALANDRGRQFAKRGPIQLGAQGDNALDTIGESERSAWKRSIGLPDRLQDRQHHQWPSW